jgi:hypothetical protein
MYLFFHKYVRNGLRVFSVILYKEELHGNKYKISTTFHGSNFQF